jgi:importin subunit beta-1
MVLKMMKSIYFLFSEISAKDSSYKCLLLVCEVSKDEVLASFMPFISNTIGGAEPNSRQASLMAFSAMLEGPNPEVLKPLITQAYTTIVSLLKDINNNVKKWTSVCIYRIAELHPYCVLNQFD